MREIHINEGSILYHLHFAGNPQSRGINFSKNNIWWCEKNRSWVIVLSQFCKGKNPYYCHNYDFIWQ